MLRNRVIAKKTSRSWGSADLVSSVRYRWRLVMTVFDLLGRVPDDSRVLELAEPLAALDAEFPGLAPKEYRGEPGRALDHIEEQLAAIVRIEEEMELVRAELPAAEADAALEARQRRGKWVLLGLLAGIVLLVVIGQGLL